MTLAVEMLIEPGADALIKDMGRRLKSKARSKGPRPSNGAA